MFYNHHALYNGHLDNDDYHLLRPTLFSNKQLLLGVDFEGKIVARRDYYNDHPLEGSYNSLHARHHSVEGRRELYRYWDCKTSAYSAAFHYQPQSGSNLDLLSSASHDVVSWHFIGLDLTDDAETSPDQEIGRFSLGRTLDESSLKADGRMWLKWSCDPMKVTPTTQINFGFADEAGNLYDKTISGYAAKLVDQHADTASKLQSFVTPMRRVPSLVLPIDRLLGRHKPEQTLETQSNFVSNFSKELANQLMDAFYGADATQDAEPYAQLPASTSSLWESDDIAREFNTVVDDPTRQLGAFKYASTADGGRLTTRTGVSRKTAKTFTFPTDPKTGVKISVRVRNRNLLGLDKRGYSLSLKCHRDDQPDIAAEHKQSIFMMSDHLHAEEASFVGGYNPQQSLWLSSGSASLHGYSTDGLEGFKAEGFSNELYEAYVMGDGHAYLYLNGDYVGRYITTPETIARGSEYTFSLVGYYTTLSFDELKVEAFTLPEDYVTPIDQPDVYAIAGWSCYQDNGTTPNLKPWLFDGELNSQTKPYYINLLDSEDYYVDFSVTAPMQLRVYSSQIPAHLWSAPVYHRSIFVLVNLVTGDETEIDLPRNQWGTVSDNLTAGRWRLRGKGGYTTISQFEVNPPIVAEPEPEPEPESEAEPQL